jgi:hypothetical protein
VGTTWKKQVGRRVRILALFLRANQPPAQPRPRSRLKLRPQRPLTVGTRARGVSPVLKQPSAVEVAVNEFSISTVI